MEIRDLILSEKRASELSVEELLQRVHVQRTSRVTKDGTIQTKTTEQKKEKALRKTLHGLGYTPEEIELTVKEWKEKEGTTNAESSQGDTPDSSGESDNLGEAKTPASWEYPGAS